jgi:hypothetical protein
MNITLNWFRSLSDTLKQMAVFSSTIVAGMILFFVTISQINCQGRKAMEPYSNSQKFINAYMDSLRKPERLQQKYFAVFKTQQKILSLRKDHYLDLGIVFFRNYYGVLILLMLFSCLGGVVLFVIANQGWLRASPSLKAFFLALAMLITFSGLFPLVFKQEDNFNENLKNYMSYTKAELNIIDQLSKLDNPYFAAKIDTINSKPVWVTDSVLYCNKVDTMITVNDIAINNLTNYVLNINAKEIKSMSDVYRSLINTIQSGQDSLKLPATK